MKLLVVDDHEIVRDGIRRLLVKQSQIEIAEASTGNEALAAARTRPFDLAIVDIELDGESGFDLISELLHTLGVRHVIVFTMHGHAGFANRAYRAGAFAFVSKAGGIAELERAVSCAMSGQRFDYTLDFHDEALTDRERTILSALGQGKTFATAASELNLAYKTVANASHRIRAKLGFPTISELVSYAVAAERHRLI